MRRGSVTPGRHLVRRGRPDGPRAAARCVGSGTRPRCPRRPAERQLRPLRPNPPPSIRHCTQRPPHRRQEARIKTRAGPDGARPIPLRARPLRRAPGAGSRRRRRARPRCPTPCKRTGCGSRRRPNPPTPPIRVHARRWGADHRAPPNRPIEARGSGSTVPLAGRARVKEAAGHGEARRDGGRRRRGGGEERNPYPSSSPLRGALV